MFSDLPNQAARACQWASTAEMWNNIFIGNSGRKKVFLIDCLGHKIAHELAQKSLVRLWPFLCSRMMSRWMLNNFSDGYSTLMVSLSCILKIMLISQSINQRKKYSFKRGRWLGTDPPPQYLHLQWFRRASPVLQEAPWSVSSTTVGSLNLTFGPGRTQKPVILRLNRFILRCLIKQKVMKATQLTWNSPLHMRQRDLGLRLSADTHCQQTQT